MKIAFCAPLKPLTHPIPSGDQAIARDVASFFQLHGEEIVTLTEFRTFRFFEHPRTILKAVLSQTEAVAKALATRPDVFFTYHSYYKAPDITGPWLSRLLGKPYVLLEAMYSEGPRSRPGFKVGYWLNRFALLQADHIFSNKTDDIKGLQKLLPPDRVTYLPPAVDVDQFSPSQERAQNFLNRFSLSRDCPIISCVAMLRPDRKADGVEFLIRSLGRLKREGFDFQFIHAGAGEMFNQVQALAQSELGDRALFIGQASRAEISELLAASRFFAFPGIDEGFGLVYLEAQACGLPVVAFQNGGIPDAVRHNVTGLLTPLLDTNAFDTALRELLSDENLRQKMGQAAREHVLSRHNRSLNYEKILLKLRELASKNL